MALTPLSVAIGSKLLIKDKAVDVIEENFEGASADVLMVGFRVMARSHRRFFWPVVSM